MRIIGKAAKAGAWGPAGAFLLPLLQGRSSLKWSIAEDRGGA
jgi:hypothetical protein